MSNIDVQDLAQYDQQRADDVMNHNPRIFWVPMVIVEGLDDLEGATALLASQVVKRTYEKTEFAAGQPARS